jgi:hypothetical protein
MNLFQLLPGVIQESTLMLSSSLTTGLVTAQQILHLQSSGANSVSQYMTILQTTPASSGSSALLIIEARQ